MYQIAVERGPGIALWLLALAAQMSGYTNAAIALALVGGAVFFLVAPAYHHGRKWHENRLQSGKRSLEPWHLIASGLAGIIVFAVVAAAGVIWQFNRETALSPQDISKIVAPFQAQIDALKWPAPGSVDTHLS